MRSTWISLASPLQDHFRVGKEPSTEQGLRVPGANLRDDDRPCRNPPYAKPDRPCLRLFKHPLRVQRSPATVRRPAYGYPWNRGPTFANQEIEIHTLICLQNVVVKSRYQPRAGGSGNPRSSQNLRWVRPLALNFPTNSAIYIRATPERRTCVGKHRTGRARKPLWIRSADPPARGVPESGPN